MFNCNNQKKEKEKWQHFFSSKIKSKNFSLISQTRIVLVTFYRDPLVMYFDLNISFSKPLFTRIAFLKYIQNNKECLTFQLILLKEDIVCCIHLFCRAFLKNPITPLSIHICTSQKRRKITCFLIQKKYEMIHLLPLQTYSLKETLKKKKQKYIVVIVKHVHFGCWVQLFHPTSYTSGSPQLLCWCGVL